MKKMFLFVAALTLAVAWQVNAQTARGKMTGGVAYTLPQWFKPSFLHFKDDVAEAHKQGKHVMVFLHLDDCPYCAKMLQENFASGDNRAFMQKHFDVIAVNVRGGLEVVWTGSYRGQAFAAYLETRDNAAVYAFRPHPRFATVTNFRNLKKPLAVLWEDRQCADCARFHDRTLNHPDVVAEMKKLLVVRLDADSKRPIVDPQGNAITPAQWVKALGLTYRPALVLYDEGREVFRFEGRLYHFHFKEALRYVSGGHYRRFGGISKYNAARREELLKQGINIDYSE
ncbi:MAG: thioredoxin fold domain-containing protein [Betaproteobacteria bacterium]|nr:thioredoxin fold domain-containing protein [Betaproteobacteria bacterium]